ncbi:hypothetical protein ACHHYP_16544 [Achlya hypogyna]|uniref:Uncharacterized protein n=1 Tax=Achlya hypogyna TaxID=1202772 RepID=A0A1V9ZE27_ACHHY|nr:hypothetical protein ACHHYP_16544 [Achlya hypogyna]
MTEEVVWEWQRPPMRLVVDDGDSLSLTAAGVAFLQSFDYPVATILVTGAADRLDHAARLLAPMEALPTADPYATPGIYVVGAADFMQSGRCVLLLDLQLPAGPSPLRAVAVAMASLVLHVGLDEVDAAAHLLAGLSDDTVNLAPFLPTMAWLSPTPDDSAFRPRVWPDMGDLARDTELAKAAHLGTIALSPAPEPTLLDVVRAHVFAAAPDKAVLGTTFTGALLLAFTDACLQPTADGALDLVGAYDHVVQLQCAPVVADALQMYRDAMDGVATESPPLELAAYEKLHADMAAMALALFASRTSFPQSPARAAAKASLRASLQALDSTQRAQLDATSEAFCVALRARLFDAHADEADAAAALAAMEAAYFAAARGPAKDRVWSRAVASAGAALLQRATAAAYASWTEDRLATERAALENAYRAKQAALVEHLAREQSQLEARVQQEQAVRAKAAAAAQARSNMEGHETRRTRDELATAQKTIVGLEEAARQQAQALDDAHEAIVALRRDVADRDAALAEEAAVRATLVDRLGEALRAETALQAKLAERQVADDTARENTTKALESALAQLRTVAEEKEMLQLKLNEFFLKASALPPAVQEHLLLCADSEPVAFADALSSYMGA